MDSGHYHAGSDINIPRKARLIEDHFSVPLPAGPPLFAVVEFNLSGLCNRECVFCPRADATVFPNTNDHISIALYEKIVRELGELDYRGMLLYSGFGEPLLAKRLEVLIETTKRFCSRARLEMVTNGDGLSAARLRSLFEAGLDTLLISMYDGPEQREHFERMRVAAGLAPERIVLRTRWLSAEEHYGIALSNRSGLVTIKEAGIGPLTEPRKRRCHYPFYTVMVDWDGAMLLCPHDWGRKLVVGNLNERSIAELWTSETLKQVRLTLAADNRDFAPCNVCDVDGTLMGERHFEGWLDFYGTRAERPAP
jgi:radical SAM protein with 4Fe4S-binding SPASM domain